MKRRHRDEEEYVVENSSVVSQLIDNVKTIRNIQLQHDKDLKNIQKDVEEFNEFKRILLDEGFPGLDEHLKIQHENISTLFERVHELETKVYALENITVQDVQNYVPDGVQEQPRAPFIGVGRYIEQKKRRSHRKRYRRNVS